MDQYIAFVSQNWMLVLGFFLILAMLTWNFISPTVRGYKPILPTNAVNLINHDDALVLDVRENNEYMGGHIINSIHIPLGTLNNRLNELEKYKNKPVIVGCRSGQRSASACATLKKQGFESVYNLSGGVMGWQNANLPLTK